MKKVILYLILFFCKESFANAQDSMRLSHHYINDSIRLEFMNESSDTLYIFSSYLKPFVYYNKYLNRFNKKENIFKVSFLPIVSHVYTVKTDVIFLGDEQIIKPFQFTYEFIRIAPNKSYSITLPFAELKNFLLHQNRIVADFDPVKYFKKKQVKYLKKPEIALVNKVKYEFAVYQNVNVLTTKASEANESDKYIKQAKSFKIKSVQLSF